MMDPEQSVALGPAGYMMDPEQSVLLGPAGYMMDPKQRQSVLRGPAG